jgi:hypothetical protein
MPFRVADDLGAIDHHGFQVQMSFSGWRVIYCPSHSGADKRLLANTRGENG